MTFSPKKYNQFLFLVKERVRSAQYEALKAVNKELITLYWDIGRMIIERQDEKGWGKGIVEQLAKDIHEEFPGLSGFSTSNIWRMRLFYQTYVKNQKLAPMVREIGWSHNVFIMERCRDDLEREFYLKMTKKFGWTKNVLALQIENQRYQKTLANQTNFDINLSGPIRDQAKLAFKDEYIFDFLEFKDEYSERELEAQIIDKVPHFLHEMGGIFTFVGNQYRIEIGGNEYFIDLLLHHRILKCLVAVELKVIPFKPEFVGKMQFYLSILDDTVRLPEEHPSIGIILCKSKNKMVVEYALRDSTKPIGVAGYRITREPPEEFKGQLPEPEQVMKLLDGIQ